MVRVFSFLFLLALSSLCFAEIHRWVDAEGKVHYSDQPPIAKPKEEKTIKTPRPGASSQPGSKSLEEQDLEFRQRHAKAEEEQKKQEQEAAQEKERKENCQRAKDQLKNLQTGGRTMKLNPNGERVYLNEEEVKEEIIKTQKAADNWCSPPKSN